MQVLRQQTHKIQFWILTRTPPRMSYPFRNKLRLGQIEYQNTDREKKIMKRHRNPIAKFKV